MSNNLEIPFTLGFAVDTELVEQQADLAIRQAQKSSGTQQQTSGTGASSPPYPEPLTAEEEKTQFEKMRETAAKRRLERRLEQERKKRVEP